MGKWNSLPQKKTKNTGFMLWKNVNVCFRNVQRFYRSFRNVLPRYSVRKKHFPLLRCSVENKRKCVFLLPTVDAPFEKTNENARFRFADVSFEKRRSETGCFRFPNAPFEKNKRKCAFLFPSCSVHAMSSFAGKWVLRTSGKKRKWESQLIRWTFGFACSRFTVKWDYTVKWEMKHFCLLVRTEMGSHFIE